MSCQQSELVTDTQQVLTPKGVTLLQCLDTFGSLRGYLRCIKQVVHLEQDIQIIEHP